MHERDADAAARAQITATYHRLYKDLLELVKTLNIIEPGGTLREEVSITHKEGERIRLAYVTTPLQVTISSPQRKFMLRVIEEDVG